MGGKRVMSDISKMNNAGKISLVPKGAYSADVMYEALDVVKQLYMYIMVAKKIILWYLLP